MATSEVWYYMKRNAFYNRDFYIHQLIPTFVRTSSWPYYDWLSLYLYVLPIHFFSFFICIDLCRKLSHTSLVIRIEFFLMQKKKKIFLFLDIFCVPFSRKSECHERCLSWLGEKASDLEALDKNIVRSVSDFCVRSEDKYVYGNSRKRFSGDENVFFRFIVGLTEDNQNECDFC